MGKETPPLFGRTRFLEGQIDEFLDKVSEAAIHFERGLTGLIDQRLSGAGEEKLQQLVDLKHRCNQIRRSVANTLYSEMLIPGFRGDVLSLLSDLYALVDVMANCFQEFMIEYTQPNHHFEMRVEAKELVDVVILSVQAAVLSARAFFRNPAAVGDHVHEIRVYESEADRIALRIKKQIFSSDLPLVLKMHARDAIDSIDRVADMAEDISDELSIYAIKRVL